MHTRERIGGTVAIVQCNSGLLILTERKVNAQTSTWSGKYRSSIHIIGYALLIQETAAQMEHFLECIFDPENALVLRKGIGGERSGEGHPMHFADVEIISRTDVQHGGNFEIRRALFQCQLVAALHQQPLNGKSVPAEGHGRTNVLECYSEVYIVRWTGDIVDTCIEANT